jgi:type VII secretion protein EccB
VWNRRDQVQAYQFLRRRLVAAFTQGNANTEERPGRRLAVAASCGAGVTVLALAVVGVMGIFQHSSKHDWASGAKIIVERETGAKFVLDGDGLLRPVLNYTSALLFLERSADVVTVSRAELATRSRGAPIGTPNAPDELPPPADLVTGPWTVCSQARLDEVGLPRAKLTVHVGFPAPKGTLLGQGTALVVQDTTTRKTFVVTQGMRYQVSSSSVLNLLGLAPAIGRPVPVGGGWLNTLPQGDDLAPIPIPSAGSGGPTIDGRPTHVGQRFALAQPGQGQQLFVLLPDGLSPIHPVGERLVAADDPATAAGSPTPLTPRGLYLAQKSSSAAVDAHLPSVIPQPASTTGDQMAICATWTDTSSNAPPELVAMPQTPGPQGVLSPAAASDPGQAAAADEVAVPPGHAALVRPPCPGPCAAGMEPFLVTDAGVRFPLGSQQVLDVLGYGKVKPTPVPLQILWLLPEGPGLMPGAGQTAARKPPLGALGAVHRAPTVG